jgi:hypothetical protein
MQVADDIYLGAFFPANGLLPATTASADPTVNQGVGPAGRIVFHNIVPLTLQINNVALSQHMVAATGLVLTAGTGNTLGTAPDGSQRAVVVLDVNRAPSLSSTSDLHLINFTVTGFDFYGHIQTATRAGPNNNTVNFTKAFASVLSIIPDTTDGTHNVSAGTSDVFGMTFTTTDAGYIMPKWANALAQDAGTFVAADATSPATNLTGDPRGTYTPSSASNGTNRLVIWQHLTANQCGPNATVVGALGVTPA